MADLQDAALVLTEHNALWCKSLLQHHQRLARIGRSAHENVERGITAFRPCVYADMALGQNSNTADTATWRKGMQVDVQKGRPRCFHCIDHCLLNAILVIEAFGLPKI